MKLLKRTRALKFKFYSLNYYSDIELELKDPRIKSIVRLEPLQEKHSKDLFEAYDYDRSIFQYINYKPPQNLEEFKKVVIQDVILNYKKSI